MATISPLIANGGLVLENGDLKMAYDIVTQTTTSVAMYDCIYSPSTNSQLITYLSGIQVGGLNQSGITNVIKSALLPLIQQNIISNLSIAISAMVVGYVEIKINATDAEGNPATVSWSNAI